MRASKSAKVSPELTGTHLRTLDSDFIAFYIRAFDHSLHLLMSTPAVTTTAISIACYECGIIQASGKISCCGRGGSWFGNCGNVENAKFGHTWHEGIRACEPRKFESQAAVGQQLHAFQPKSNVSPDVASMDMHSKVAFLPAHNILSAPTNLSTPISNGTSIAAAANTSVTAPSDKSILYGAGRFTSTALVVTNTTTNITDMSTLTLKSSRMNQAIAPRTSPTTIALVNPASTTLLNQTIITPNARQRITRSLKPTRIKPILRTSVDKFKMISSRVSARVSNVARDCKQLLKVVVHISIIAIIIC